jgi:hypothetical protein
LDEFCWSRGVNAALLRIRAITSTDFRIRFRRSSTAVIFLLLCIAAYLWIPDPSTGRALLQMKEQRALYNSPALAMATASLCGILLGLVGYYLVSNSIGRDIRTRTGFVIASTTVRNHEYLIGIFLGNVLFLSVIILGFMVSSIVMQLVRGEAAVRFSSFLWHYALLLPPMIIFVSAIAVLFESVRWLSGRFGDLCYFFVWMFAFATVAVSAEKLGGTNWSSYFDTFSFAFMLEQVKQITGSDSLSIGSSSFDASKPPFLFPGLTLSRSWILPRIVSTLFPLVFVIGAIFVFPRFNPTRIKSSQVGSRKSLLGRLNALVRPLTVPLLSMRSFSARPGFFNAIFSELMLTLQLKPITVFVLMGSFVAAIFSGIPVIQQKLLPAFFVSVAMILADLPTREKRVGTSTMLESMPLLKPHFVWWKVGTAFAIVLLFVTIPSLRLFFHKPSAAISLVIGSAFLASSAIGLGIASGNPKTFMVSFLMFLYLVINDGGKTPGFDFAGWYGIATVSVQMTYLLLSGGMILFALVIYRRQQKAK